MEYHSCNKCVEISLVKIIFAFCENFNFSGGSKSPHDTIDAGSMWAGINKKLLPHLADFGHQRGGKDLSESIKKVKICDKNLFSNNSWITF